MATSETRTRQSLHALAEHVLAAARHAATGRIGLRVVPGGFGTPPFPGPAGDRQVLVVDGELVLREAGGERRAPITTLRAAGAFAGVAPGAPAAVYTPSTPGDPDEPLAVDQGAVRALAAWFALADEALRALCAEAEDAHPAEIQLWPEHFDVATTIDEVNYGGSPGDDDHGEPYVYVGPWTPRDGDFWNEPFGASRSRWAIPDAAAALAFFREGRARAAAPA